VTIVRGSFELRKVYAIILASGVGQRMGRPLPKQFLQLAGRTILEHTLDAFQAHPQVDEIILVTHPQSRQRVIDILQRNAYAKLRQVIDGGTTRQASSRAGVEAIAEDDALVLVHDAARPLVSQRVIRDCIQALGKYEAVSAAIPVTDTILQVDVSGQIQQIPDRRQLWQAQTPQGFHVGVLRKAHQLAATDQEADGAASDDCSLILRYRLAPVHVVEGDPNNLKITYPRDLTVAERLLHQE
jgi:2-C-methyl-D-erythritol 4-phosphate cytidylyltransferase